jgi:hypothetical protein
VVVHEDNHGSIFSKLADNLASDEAHVIQAQASCRRRMDNSGENNDWHSIFNASIGICVVVKGNCKTVHEIVDLVNRHDDCVL